MPDQVRYDGLFDLIEFGSNFAWARATPPAHVGPGQSRELGLLEAEPLPSFLRRVPKLIGSDYLPAAGSPNPIRAATPAQERRPGRTAAA
jgi:hypothetical protein